MTNILDHRRPDGERCRFSGCETRRPDGICPDRCMVAEGPHDASQHAWVLDGPGDLDTCGVRVWCPVTSRAHGPRVLDDGHTGCPICQVFCETAWPLISGQSVPGGRIVKQA